MPLKRIGGADGGGAGNLSDIFYPKGGYLEPRPKTCSARIGTDGWSAWTFTYGQGSSPPRPSFWANSSGNITTPHGARFCVQPPQVVFVSQWVNYPTHVTVSLSEAKVQAGDVVWLLISGSTNNMQTRLANARLNFSYTHDQGEELVAATETLELIPPLNYWTLSPVAGVYYDYVRDGFCLPPTPPATVQLGDANNANVYSWRASAQMESVTLEAMSLEVVIGLVAVSVSRHSVAEVPERPPLGQSQWSK